MNAGAKVLRQPMAHQSFKQALHATIHGSDLPPKALADLVGVSYAVLCAWGDESIPDAYPSGRRIVKLAGAASDGSAVAYLAELRGRMVIDAPVGHGTEGDVLMEVGAFLAALSHGQGIQASGRRAMAAIAREVARRT